MMSFGIQPSNAADFPGTDSNNYLIGYIPADAVVTNAYCVVAGTDSSASTLTVGTSEGSSNILSGVDLTASGNYGPSNILLATGTGVPVYVTLGGPVTTAFIVVNIYYDEYSLTTGELTPIG